MVTAEFPIVRVEIIPKRLYFTVLNRVPALSSYPLTDDYLCVDDTLRYEPFYSDFGPLNLGQTYRFCELIEQRLKQNEPTGKTLIYYCLNKPTNKSNAAILIGCYCMFYLNQSPNNIYDNYLKPYEPFLPFKDASEGICTFRLTIVHTLNGLYKAEQSKFFDFKNFDIEHYEKYEQVENGDLNIIVPNKFIAFSGPMGLINSSELHGVSGLSSAVLRPRDYVSIFKKLNVKAVIRLNKKCYNKNEFIENGIQHYDLFFTDGSNPPLTLLDKFIKICEETNGAVAVHCKAGLGRTGTTIACYLMKHYHFTAAEVIGYLRVVRPGSVIGPQQNFLKAQEQRMWKMGNNKQQQQQYPQTNKITEDVIMQDSVTLHPIVMRKAVNNKRSLPAAQLSSTMKVANMRSNAPFAVSSLSSTGSKLLRANSAKAYDQVAQVTNVYLGTSSLRTRRVTRLPPTATIASRTRLALRA